MEHFREVEKRTICDKLAGQFYLKREEYAARCPTWCKEACWDVLALEWSGPKFKDRSEKTVPIATAVSLNHTKEGPTLLQQ